MSKIKIGTDEHVFIAGMTGTGKSTIAEVYLAGFENVVKLDTKGEVYERRKKKKGLWYGLEEGKDFTVVERLEQLQEVETSRIIYAPRYEELNEEYYNALLKWCYDRENTQVWIDELMEVAPSPAKYPSFLKAIYTRGRSKNVSIWACTQRPVDIPVIAMANSTHYFIFDLMAPQDRKRIVDMTGVPDFYELPEGYNFWYFRVGMREPRKAVLKF